MAEDNTGDGGGKTFTQAELDAIVRDRLKRERDKFADYDDLKKQAGDADKNRSALEKLLDRFGVLEAKLAESAERDLRAEVAEKKGLTRAQARRLVGKTLDEMMSDADDLLASFKPSPDGGGDDGKDGAKGDGKDGGDAGKTGDAGKDSGDAGKTAEGGKDGAGKGDGKSGDEGGKGEGKPLPPSGRPTEKLNSGAVPGSSGDKTPAQIAEDILSRPF